MDISSIVLGLVLAFAFGGIALLILVYAPPGSEKLADALVSAAIKLVDAAVKALNKSMAKQDMVISDRTYDPVPEMRLDELEGVAHTLREWRRA